MGWKEGKGGGMVKAWMWIIVWLYFQQQQSVQMLPGKKAKPKRNKSRPKKQRTFNTSEISLPDEQPRPTSSTDIKANPLFRRRNLQSQAATSIKNNRSVRVLQANTKKRGKSRGRLDKCQTYQVIPYKSSLNSEIVFSNQETRRQGSFEQSSSELAIRVNQQYLLDDNKLLRISIRKQYLRKVDAAVKIQKVFRGYLTRKVLQNCLDNQQRKLQDRLAQIRSESVSEHSSYFTDKENVIGEPRRRAVDQGVFQYSEANPQESEQQQEAVVYRHHQPIYSHDEISGYLDSSEEEDFDRDAFDNHIIFQTNEEYIDSRKSSQQPQTKNKLSRPQAVIIQEQLDSPAEAQRQALLQNLVKTEKKQQRIQFKLEQLQPNLREETVRIKDEQINQIDQRKMLSPGGGFSEGQATLNRRGEECRSVQRLKEEELQRWEQVIQLVQSQIGRAQDNAEMGTFMQRLMELSIKNKQSLELPPPLSPANSGLSIKQDSREKIRSLRAQRQYLTHQNNQQKQESDGRKQLKTLAEKALFFQQSHSQQTSNAAANPLSPLSSFDTTGQLKRFLQENTQDHHVQEMLRLREDLLKKRYQQDLRKANIDLVQKIITQQQFEKRVQSINKKYEQERACINRSRQDINRGHRAALKLSREAVSDAKKLGYELPVSRSVQGLRFKSPLLLADIVVDEVGRQRQSLSEMREPDETIHVDAESEQSSDLQFTEEQLRRFRRAQPYDIQLAQEIADLGRNVMISQQLLRQQQVEQNNLMMTQHVSRQIYEIEESTPPKPSPINEALCQWVFNAIAWQVAGELMLRPAFAQRLVDRGHLLRPQPVTDKERLEFLALLEQHFPPVAALNAKLNQKICPLPGELLRCMRIDFSQDEDDNNSYEEIGKYEFIISQEVCNQAIRQFRSMVDGNCPAVVSAADEAERIGREWALNEKVIKYVQQREKYLYSRRNHTRQLRWEVLNIQVHCLFDAWNEQLIFLRSQKTGYSGIGLNELTLSVRDHNWQVHPTQTLSIITEGKQRLLRTLALSSPAILFPECMEQQQEQLLQLDSKWIFYADEALSYGLQLVYLIEEQIFSECGKELRKRMLAF